MMKRITILAVATMAPLGMAQADVLFYGGDFDGRARLENQNNNFLGLTAVYENFTVTSPGWVISDLSILMFGTYKSNSADYEIRTGVSAGNGGNVVASGSDVPAQATATGQTFQGLPGSIVLVSGLSIALDPGEYWLMVRPVTESCGTGHLHTAAATTSGANGVGSPLGDGNSFYFRPGVHNFVPTSNVLGGGTWDFSYRIEGSPIPEPGTLAVVGFGIAALVARRRKTA